MKKFLPLLLLISASAVKAQTFTLTQLANDPLVGDTNKVYNLDTTMTGNLNASAAGNNVLWNYSQLFGSGANVVTAYVSPGSVPSSSNYPGCTIVAKQGSSSYSYYKSVSSPSTQLEFMGVSSTSLSMNFTNTAIYNRYPFAFSNNVTDTYSGNFTFSLSGTATGNGTTVAEGTGTLVLATGTLNNVLKIKSISNTTLNAGFISGTLKQTVYNFYHASQKFPIMTINYQTITVAGSPTVSSIVTGNTSNFLIGLKENMLDEAAFSIYPNPAANLLSIDVKSIHPQEMIIRNQLGQVMLQSSYNKSIDISGLNGGIYYLEIKSKEGNAVRKFIKQ